MYHDFSFGCLYFKLPFVQNLEECDATEVDNSDNAWPNIFFQYPAMRVSIQTYKQEY